MKYLITESQIDRIVFKYLDNQDFIKSEEDGFIYFINSEGDEYNQIRYYEGDGVCTINSLLVREISKFFSLSNGHSIDVIGKWVEHTLQMGVSRIFTAILYRED
jgi:hypothetical protein